MISTNDRLDICTALYGKMRKARGYFYWAPNKSALVDIRNGENILKHLGLQTLAQYENVRYIKNKNEYIVYENVKILRDAVAVINEQGQTVIYNTASNPIIVLDWGFSTRHTQEILVEGYKKAIILFDSPTAKGYKRGILIDTYAGQLLKYWNDLDRIYIEDKGVVMIRFGENGYETIKFKY